MSRLQQKAEGHTKQIVGQMVGDNRLEVEGKQQVLAAESKQPASHSDHGIVKDQKAEEQPKDKERAQTAHQTDSENSVSKEKTRDVR